MKSLRTVFELFLLNVRHSFSKVTSSNVLLDQNPKIQFENRKKDSFSLKVTQTVHRLSKQMPVNFLSIS